MTRIGCLGGNEACRAGIENLAHGGEDVGGLASLIRAAPERSPDCGPTGATRGRALS